MKSLQESLLDNENILMDDTEIEKFIKDFINDNYDIKYCKYTINGNIVNADGHIILTNFSAPSLTNGLFKWGKVNGDFNCTDNKKLKSLEGAPEEVNGNFNCFRCINLKTLEGSPKKVSKDFNCSGCDKLASLKGAPEKVGGIFKCCFCNNLTSLEDAPKEVGGDFDCCCCRKLTSLKGAPKDVGGIFDCYNCGKHFTEEEVRKYSYVVKKIHTSF